MCEPRRFRIEPLRPAAGARPVLAHNRWVARFLLAYVAAFSIFTGWITAQFPPAYFAQPRLWGFGFAVGGIMAGVALFAPHWPMISLWSGAVVSALAVGRALFIASSISFDQWVRVVGVGVRPDDPAASSQVIAVFQWAAFALLVLVSWPALIHDAGLRRSDQ